MSGDIVLDGSAQLLADELANEGVIEGSGTVVSTLVNHGTISPGSEGAIGQLQFTNDLLALPSSQFEIDLAATGTENDLISVGGTVVLDGTLRVRIPGGGGGGVYEPNVGDEFTILTASQINGGFASKDLPGLPNGLDWELIVEATFIDLVIALTADFNGDSVVDGQDFLIWQSHFGMVANATHSQGDADADGDVDGNDFLAWQSTFGQRPPRRRAHAVPAPLASSLTWVMLLAYTSRRYAEKPPNYQKDPRGLF